MADSSVGITAGSGTSIDTRTEATNGHHRQVVVIGDPSTNAGVAPVDATSGLSVSVTNSTIAVTDNSTTLSVDDGGSTVSVDDGGSSLTIDGTVTANLSATDNAVIDSIDTSTQGILSDTASIQTAVETLDDVVKAEDAAHSSGDKGVMALAVRQDTQADFGADGDYVPLSIDADGKLRVAASVSASVAIGSEYDEDAAHTTGDTGSFVLAVRKDTAAALADTDGDYAPLEIDANGRLHVLDQNSAAIKTAVETLDNAVSGSEIQVDVVGALPAGTNAIGKLAANSGVDIGDVDITSIAAGDNNIGNVDVASIAAGTNNIGDVDVFSNTAKDGSGTRYQPLVDTDGHLQIDVLSGGGGGTQYTEADTDASITGTAVLWEDTSDTLRAVSAAKPLPVEIIAGAGSGGTAAADDADFTAGTTSGTPAQGVYESTPTSVTDGDLGTVGITSGRRLKTSTTIDAALPAGTNAIGKLAANSGVDIGDVTIDNATLAVTQSGTWDEVGINDSGNSITVDNAQLSVVGTGTEATAMRVTIASDSTGVLSVDDNGGAITVDGTVAVTGVSTLAEQQTQTTHLATIAGDTTSIQTAVEILDNAISGSEMQVDVVGALPAGTNAIGKLAANSGVDIGDVDVASVVPGTGATNLGKAEDAAHTTGDVGVMMMGVRNGDLDALTNAEKDYSPIGVSSVGAVFTTMLHTDGTSITDSGGLYVISRGDTAHDSVDLGNPLKVGGKAHSATPTAVAANDRVNAYFDLRGRQQITPAIPEQDLATEATTHVKKYYTNAGAVTDGIVWSPAAGKRWYVTDLIINVSAAATVTFEDDKAGGDEAVMKFELAANSGIAHSFNTPWFSGEDAADLIVTTSAGNVYITVTGYEI